MAETHSSPIQSPQQLIWAIALAFVVPIVVIVLLVTWVTGKPVAGAGSTAMTPEAIADRLRPVGSVVLAGSSGPRALQTGQAVYTAYCTACHGAGIAGAPKTGDLAAWAPRIKQGYDLLVKHAVEGISSKPGVVMPAKGGNPALDSVEVARAVVFMVNQSGANFKEPEAPAATPAQVPATPAPAPAK
jgi:cytochrome c5